MKHYADSGLENFRLLARGNRLSVMPVSEEHWKFILSLKD
ncbi:MAG: EVE domain-containing protein [Chromatiaceae bacterium]